MSVLSFDQYLALPASTRKSKILADTSFVLRIKAESDGEFSPDCQRFFEEAKRLGIQFIISVTVYQELLKRLRHLLLLDEVKSNTTMAKETIDCLLDKNARELEKRLFDKGKWKVFDRALGNDKLKKYIDEIEVGFDYLQGTKMKSQDAWPKTIKLMADYYLDSSDAMILNFGLHHDELAGLATCDSGFTTYKSDRNFHIIVPRNLPRA